MLYNKIFRNLLLLLAISNQLLCHPIPNKDDEIYIDSRLVTYRKRFLILSQDIEPKYSSDLISLIGQFELELESGDVMSKANMLENFMEQLDPDFSFYLQYQLDVQHFDEDINIDFWFLEQLLPQIDDADLAADIKQLLPLYEFAKSSRSIEEKYEVFTEINEKFSEDLLNYFDAMPVPAALLNTHLEFFREFLLFLINECIFGGFEGNIKISLEALELALGENVAYEQKAKLLDQFNDFESSFGKFLDAKVHEFEIYKFGRN